MNPSSTPPVVIPSVPLAQNRRSGNRHKLNIPATLVGGADAVLPIEIIVTEISVGGVGFRCTKQLTPDAVYHLTSFDTLIPPGMRVRVLSQQLASQGEYKIGAQTVA
jgi:hypothetical protein